MKSKFGEKFNHDPIADDYDQNVIDESNPIRTGYAELLAWVQEQVDGSKHIVDLGCGTGNTTKGLRGSESVICVDISENMLVIAREKLQENSKISFVRSDLLEFCQNSPAQGIDALVSTYAIHHLTQQEKHSLFSDIYEMLEKGGKAVFGDLMFENKQEEQKMREKYSDLIEDFDDELFWYVEDEVKALTQLGFFVETKRFSDLSWGILCKKV